MKRVGLGVFLGCLAIVAEASAAPIYTPIGAELGDQVSGNCFPIGCASAPQFYQQIYSSSFFTDDGLISGMRFRADETSQNSLQSFVETFPFVEISLGVTTTAPDTFGGLLLGTGMTKVFAGPLTLTHNGTTASAFDIVMNFTTPYSYDKSAGNLLFQFATGSTPTVITGGIVGRSFFLDAANASGDGISRRTSIATDDTGLVTAFDVSPAAAPVPEPASVLLLGSGIAGIAARVRARRKRFRN